jgi:hypothetical protein
MVFPSVMFWFAVMVSAAKDVVKEEVKQEKKRRMGRAIRRFISVFNQNLFQFESQAMALNE